MGATWDELKGGAARPSDSVRVCLRGDLAAAYTAAERRLADAAGADDDSMAGGVEALAIAEQMAVLREEMAQHTFRFTFRALPRRAYRELVDAHPPRPGHPEDGAYGADMDGFPPALIAACCVAITPAAEPEPDVPADAPPVLASADAAEMVDRLTDGQVHALFACAWRLNRSGVDLPKSVSVSGLVARHAPRSRPPEPGG